MGKKDKLNDSLDIDTIIERSFFRLKRFYTENEYGKLRQEIIQYINMCYSRKGKYPEVGEVFREISFDKGVKKQHCSGKRCDTKNPREGVIKTPRASNRANQSYIYHTDHPPRPRLYSDEEA